jgi:ferredoxin
MARARQPEASASTSPVLGSQAANAVPVLLVVDLNRCQAYAQCCFLAPSVFELHGEEVLWYDPAPDEAQRERVLRAAASCPVQAITVECLEPTSERHADEP